MKYLSYNRLAFSLFVLVGIAVCNTQLFGQVTPRWFDINPSHSNGDNNSASGGRINHVGAAADFSRVYAATEWGGLYTSGDQGNTWVKINTYSPTVTWDVKVDPSSNQIVYATSFYDGRAVNPQSGISVSNDAGTTWVPVNFTTNPLNCAIATANSEPSGWQIAINPNAPSNVFVGTNCGLARSTNRGANWTFIDPTPLDGSAEQIFAVVVSGRQNVDVIGANGHLRSVDNGVNWSPVPVAGPGPIAVNSGPTSGLAVSPAESTVLFAQNGTNIWESDNGGATWPTSLNLPLRNGGSNAQGRVPFIKTNQLSNSSQFDIWYGDVNVFKETATTPSSVPPGTVGPPRAPLNSWTNMQGQAHWDSGDVVFDPRFRSGACPRFYTSDGGVFLGNDVNNPSCQNQSWNQPAITAHATWIWGLDGRLQSGRQHALVYGLQDDGGWAATNVAEGHNPPPPNWNNFTCCDLSDNAEDDSNVIGSEGFFAGRVIQLFVRNQDGSGSSQISNYPSNGTFTPFSAGKGIARFGPKAFAVNPSDGVYFTNDITAGTISWTSLNLPVIAGTSNAGSIKIANLGGRPNVYFHSGDGNESSPGQIFISTMVATTGAPGSNWTPLTLPGGVNTVTVYDVDPTNGNRVIISGINSVSNNFEVWKTEDLGANWTRLPQLERLMVGNNSTGTGTNVFKNFASQGRVTRSFGGTFNFGTSWQPSLFQFDPLDPTTIIAGAVDAGVFLSLDNGSNWQLLSNPISPTSTSPHIPRPLFAYFSPGRFNASTNSFDVWVGTRGNGVMKVVCDQRRPGG